MSGHKALSIVLILGLNGQNARASDKAGHYLGMYAIHGRVTHDDMAKLLGSIGAL